MGPHMGPQRRSSEIAPPPDARFSEAPAGQPIVHPAAAFHVLARDAFRDRAEREARRRAERAERGKDGSAPIARSGSVSEKALRSGPPTPENVEPMRAPPSPTCIVNAVAASPAPGAGRATAAIIPWPRRERTLRAAMASIDAPRAARASRDVGAPEVKAPEVKAPEVKASEVDAPEVDAPKADPKPAASEPAKPASAPFSAAEFWGNKNKKKAFGGGGGDGGGGSGGVSGDRRFNQDDVAGAVIVLLILLLGG